MNFICSKCGYTGDGPDFPHQRPLDGRDCHYVATRAPQFATGDDKAVYDSIAANYATPHAPAQSALDEARKGEALNCGLHEMTLKTVNEQAWAIEQLGAELDELRREVEALRADAERWRDWMEAQRLIEEEMPEGYRVILDCSPGDWSLEFCDPECERIRIDDYESTEDFIRTAVACAKERAAIDTARASTDDGVGK